MSYLALYRKYRPQKFEDIIGQEHIIKTLTNQIKTGRVGHAYLFCGSRGTGKTTTARIFARAINCLSPKNGSPCGECEVCRALSSGENFDIIEIDAASNNGVDDARELREQVKFMPVVGKKKVFIIDEVHMLSTSAFNALLKTLEEPPEHVVFIFGTTEIQKLPATILSRLMRFDFHLLSVSQIEQVLKKILEADGVAFENDAVTMVARQGEGSMRDAISLLDSCLSYSPEKLTTESVVAVLGTASREEVLNLISSVAASNIKQMITSLDGMLTGGKSPIVIYKEIISLLRDLAICESLGDGAKTIVQVGDDIFAKMLVSAKEIGSGKIIAMINALSSTESELRLSVHPRLVLEMALFKAVAALSPLPDFNAGGGQAPAAKPQLDNVFTITKSVQSVNVLGLLLQNFRKNGKIKLTTALAEAESAQIVGRKLKIVAEPDTIEALEAVKQELLAATSDRGVTEVELSVKIGEISKIESLKNLFGNKLSITNN